MVGVAERFVIPDDLARAAAGEGREDWLAELPALVARIAADWRIEVGDPFLPGGMTAWVAPPAMMRAQTSRSRSAGRTRRPNVRPTAFGRGTEPGHYVSAR